MVHALDYLNSKITSNYQFLVPVEKETDCAAFKGSNTIFWQQDVNDGMQNYAIIQIGGKNSNKYVITIGGLLLTWTGGVGRPKDIVMKSGSEFGAPEFIWEIQYLSGTGEDAIYHIIHNETQDLLARIGGGEVFRPDLHVASLWSRDNSDKKTQQFKIRNAKELIVPTSGLGTSHPIDIIAEECKIKSWEYSVPKTIPDILIGESLVPFFLLEDNKSGRQNAGPYFLLERTMAAELDKLERFDGDSPVTKGIINNSSQSSHSVTELMEKMHIGVKAGASMKGINLGADFSYDLQLTKSAGSAYTEGNSNETTINFEKGTKAVFATWSVIETFTIYDTLRNPVGTPYSIAYVENTYWDDD